MIAATDWNGWLLLIGMVEFLALAPLAATIWGWRGYPAGYQWHHLPGARCLSCRFLLTGPRLGESALCVYPSAGRRGEVWEKNVEFDCCQRWEPGSHPRRLDGELCDELLTYREFKKGLRKHEQEHDS